MRRWISPRTSSMLAATATLALLAPTAASADPHEPTVPTDDPAAAAAGWLATQLVDGERIESQWGADPGLTADVVLAMAGAEVAGDAIASATDWLETEAETYTGPDDEVYAGATAKLMITLQATGRDTTVDGLDLTAQLEAREQDSGRFTDESEWGDYSSTITQSLAVIALDREQGTDPSAASVDYLLDQQCDEGGFPQDLEADECVPQIDATGFAVQALAAVGEDAAASDAADWLVALQEDHGGFVGAEGTANANSTGLAALALAVAGEDTAAAAARDFIVGLQDGCDGTEPGSIRYDATENPEVERPRATSQAVPGLTATSLAEVDATGATADVPALDCADEPPADDPGADDPSFSDVGPDNVHHDAIIELARRGVLEGWPDGTYRPAADLTRGQLASVLARAAGVDPVADGPFTDVAGSPHEGAINALAEAGVVQGYPDDTYRPQAPMRRDHVAALVGRWLEVEGVDQDRFDDLDTTIHAPLINALADIDVVRGDGDGRFHPARQIRRDQTASLVHRALQVLEDGAVS